MKLSRESEREAIRVRLRYAPVSTGAIRQFLDMCHQLAEQAVLSAERDVPAGRRGIDSGESSAGSD